MPSGCIFALEGSARGPHGNPVAASLLGDLGSLPADAGGGCLKVTQDLSSNLKPQVPLTTSQAIRLTSATGNLHHVAERFIAKSRRQIQSTPMMTCSPRFRVTGTRTTNCDFTCNKGNFEYHDSSSRVWKQRSGSVMMQGKQAILRNKNTYLHVGR